MKDYFKVIFNYENVPKVYRKSMEKWFVANRNEVVDLFNNNIDKINKIWESTGEPWSFGDFVEDINPKYVACIRRYLSTSLACINNKHKRFKFAIDDYGDIVGQIKNRPGSKLFITLKKVES